MRTPRPAFCRDSARIPTEREARASSWGRGRRVGSAPQGWFEAGGMRTAGPLRTAPPALCRGSRRRAPRQRAGLRSEDGRLSSNPRPELGLCSGGDEDGRAPRSAVIPAESLRNAGRGRPLGRESVDGWVGVRWDRTHLQRTCSKPPQPEDSA